MCRGQVFVASNPSTDNIRDILDGVVRVTGLEEWDARKPADGEYFSHELEKRGES